MQYALLSGIVIMLLAGCVSETTTYSEPLSGNKIQVSKSLQQQCKALQQSTTSINNNIDWNVHYKINQFRQTASPYQQYGEAQVQIGNSVEISLDKFQENNTGQYCVSPKIQVEIFTKQPLTIELSPEVANLTECQSRYIQQHELKHIEISRNVVLSEVAKIQNKYSNIPVMYFENEANVKQWLNQFTKKVSDDISNNITKNINNQNQLLDSKESFKRLDQVCNG